ncbi:MAG: NAD(P)(+) transhydrogenase (Re/Si-specific) subunit beta [Gammaproteobacteria bacterium]|nr:NAD(P)(+) transhydrogenase (Re/Si-specific) subunit beta [Gammaproteobacteria bacterium]
MDNVIQISYFVSAVLFILGLKRMSSPVTARGGIVWAGAGMLVATLITFFYPGMENYLLMTVAIAIGGGLAFWSGKRVAMTDMPQMIALYNGMGGGAAGAIAAVELLRGDFPSMTFMTLAVAGALIGSVSFSGSLVAFAKLQGWLRRPLRFPGQQFFNLGLLLAAICLGGWLVMQGNTPGGLILLFFALALAYGMMMALPIGGADMPVIISLFNALTGLAVAFEGFVLNNAAMIIAGTVVGSAGTLLTQLMAKAMNRSISSVLFSAFGSSEESVAGDVTGSMKPIDAADVGIMMAYAERVVIIPGYGMAVAQAQHKVHELAELLQKRGVNVKFAIHPVAGRMPGHMNVLLAEANVSYDLLYDLDEINPAFPQTDVALVIGANDVVNPLARTNPDSPIYGMPILNADQSKNVIVIKRGQGKGFSGVENALFYADNTRMLYGDGQAMVGELIQAIKEL